MERQIFTVIPNGKNWELRRGDDILSQFDLKENAVSEGQKIAKENQPSQLRIKGLDGEFQNEWTYQNDPPEYPS